MSAAVIPDPLDTSSLSAQVYRRLRTSLMRAELAPEQRLKIRELALRMGTSETPVREAIMQLAQEGALEIKPRHFVRVRKASLAEYVEIRDIRLQLEPLAAERAMSRIGPAELEELAESHRRLRHAERSADWPTAVQANFDFHFGLYWRSCMPTLITILESLWIRVGPMLTHLYPHAHPTYAERHQHEIVLDALRASDSYSLREAIRQDLLEGGRNLVRHLEALEKGPGEASPGER